MRTKELNVSLEFRRGTLGKLQSTGALVSEMLFGNPNYPNTPPVTKGQLDGLHADTEAAAVACEYGGPLATAQKKNCMEAERGALKKLALYVGSYCDNDMEKLLSSGFDVAGSSSGRTPLANPTSATLANAGASKMSLKTDVVRNAAMYECQYALVGEDGKPGPWNASVLSTKSKLEILGLTGGAIYVFRMRALGGLTGYSEWTPTVSGRCL